MSNVPKLRFKEFEDEWEEKKLKEIAIIISGSTPPRSNYDYFKEGTIPWVKTMDLNNSIVNTTSEKITNKAVLDRNLKIVPENTLLIAMYGGFNQIGRTGILNFEGTINQAISALIPKDNMFNAAYLQQYLNLNVMKWRMFAASSRKDPNITKKDVENFQVCLPSIEEQNKLSDFFVVINKKIQKQQEKIESLKEQKKGYMQKIFNRELRLNDGIGRNFPEWEVVKIGDVFSERTEKGNESYELLSVTLEQGVIRRSQIDAKDNSNPNKSKYKVVNKGDIVYNSMRMWQGANGVSSYEGIVSPAYTVLIPSERVHPLFISYLFKHDHMIYEFKRYSQGLTSDTWNLKYPQISEIKVKLPCKSEQERIGQFFNLIDRKIKFETKKLNEMIQKKRFFMQNMFL